MTGQDCPSGSGGRCRAWADALCRAMVRKIRRAAVDADEGYGVYPARRRCRQHCKPEVGADAVQLGPVVRRRTEAFGKVKLAAAILKRHAVPADVGHKVERHFNPRLIRRAKVPVRCFGWMNAR